MTCLPIKKEDRAVVGLTIVNQFDDQVKKAAIMEQIIRNGRYGTCGECPKYLDPVSGEYIILPDKCRFTNRYDHWLGGSEYEIFLRGQR